MPSRSAIAALVAVLALSACAPKVAPPIVTPRPTRPPVATPSPTPAKVVTEPYFANYLDAPETPGNWSYAQFPFGTQAIYNSGDPATSFALSCVAADRRITFTRPLAAPQAQAFEIVTESVSRSLSAVPAQGGAPALVATLDPSDDILDAMAITKGRFAVQTSGARTLYIPAWVEVSRVIEDCR
jgi:hypothetical protein